MATTEAGHHANRFYIDQDGNPHLNGSTLYLDESGNGFSGSTQALGDDDTLTFGGVVTELWETADANANKFLVELPAGDSTDVPVIVIGQAIQNVDMGIHNGLVNPTVSIIGTGAVATGPVIEFRKSRGTATSPTVVTSADDTGSINSYACVAAAEWVQNAQILFECTGTVATTRGPGVITFKTATDAAPSVLTTALTLNASQNVTIGGGGATQTLTFDTTGTDVTITASSAALAFGAITLNVTGTRFVQSYHTNITSTNAVTVDSSKTVKKAITKYAGDALAFLDRMNIVTYRHKEELDPTGQTKLGIIAESVAEPLAVDMISGDDGEYPGVNLYGLLALSARAIQQLSAKVASLEAKAAV